MAKYAPSILAIAAFFIVPGSNLWLTAAAVAMNFYGVSENRRMQAAAIDAYNNSLRDRLASVNSTTAPRELVLGRVRKGGAVFYKASTGNQKRDLYLAIAFAGHEIDGFEQIYLNDTPVTLDGSGFVMTAPYATTKREIKTLAPTAAATVNISNFIDTEDFSTPVMASIALGAVKAYKKVGYYTTEVTITKTSGGTVGPWVYTIDTTGGGMVTVEYEYYITSGSSAVQIELKTGAAGQTASTLLSTAFPTEWPATNVVEGVAYMVVRMSYSETAFPSGIPSITAVVRGAKVYDPRADSTSGVAGASGSQRAATPSTWTWSQNPALHIRHIYTHAKFGRTTSVTVDEDTQIAQTASACDTATSYTGFTGNNLLTSPGDLSSASWTKTLVTVDTAYSGVAPPSGVGNSTALLSGGTTAEVWQAGTLDFVGPTAPGQSLSQLSVADRDYLFKVKLREHPSNPGNTLKIQVKDNTGASSFTAVTLTNTWVEYSVSLRTAVTATAVTAYIGGANSLLLNTRVLVDSPLLLGSQRSSYPLFQSDTVVTFGERPADALDRIAQAMAGMWAFSGGRLFLRAGVYTAPAQSIVEADLVGQVSGSASASPSIDISANKEKAGMLNTIKVKIADKAQDYKETTLPPLAPASYLARDGEVLAQELSLSAVSFAAQAQHIAGVILRDGRDPTTVAISVKLSCYRVQLFDCVSLTIPRYGWSAKEFLVMGRTWTADGMIRLTLKETSAAITSLDANFQVGGLAQNTRLPNPWSATPVTGLAATSGTNSLIRQADGTVVSRISVTWNSLSDISLSREGQVEVQVRQAGSTDAWSSYTASGDSLGLFVSPALDGGIYLIRARTMSSLSTSDWCAVVTHTVVGKTAPPSDVTGLTYSTELFGVRLKWTAIADLDVLGYEIRVGGSGWDTGATTLVQTADSEYLWKVQTAATYPVWVKARDTTKNYSANAASLSVVVAPPEGSTLNWALAGSSEVLSWSIPTSGFQIDRFEIREGATWTTNPTPVDTTKQTSLTRKVDYPAGDRRYWVAAVDSAGNYSSPTSRLVTVNAPSAVTSGRSEIVDNNVLLYWTAPALGLGQLTVDRYEVRKGASWAAGTVVGSNGNSTFLAVFEQVGGAYLYWVAGYDSANNPGPAVSIAASVNQPPDYVLRNDYNSTFAGTAVNLYTENGKLLGPVDTSQTWTTHFTANGWATPQAQVDAGFPIYANPSLTNGSYEETLDYGAAIPSTVATATLGTTTINGSVSVTCTLSWKLLAGDPWTVLTAGVTSALIPQFRYLRVRYDFSCTAGSNLLQLNTLNVKLAVKLRNDSGAVSAANSSSTLTTVSGVNAYWTTVTFGYPFLSADCPIVQPNSVVNLTAIVNYVGGANPTGFQVAFLNASTGANVASVPFSWTSRGY